CGARATYSPSRGIIRLVYKADDKILFWRAFAGLIFELSNAKFGQSLINSFSEEDVKQRVKQIQNVEMTKSSPYAVDIMKKGVELYNWPPIYKFYESTDDSTYEKHSNITENLCLCLKKYK
ncbi:MAG: hypothetical protein WD512_10265, partial [Candidatus Paceibacterota bacterium]